MIKIAICDDEKYYQKTINTILQNYLNELQIIFEIDIYKSGKELCALGIGLAKYDVVFLDINMEYYNGIETAKKIRKYNSDIYIVFVTSYVSYAVLGYEVEAVRYILKNNINFQSALVECMDTILAKMRYKIDKIKFSFLEGERYISIEKILYVESKQHKVFFHIKGEKITLYSLYKKLDEIEKQLDEYGFLRIHKSYLVNTDYIERLSNYKVVLTSEEILPIPKLRYKSVKENFILHKGEV